MNTDALFKFEYGLYLVTAHHIKDNGCIINTAMQVTADPLQLCIAINKSNLTHDMIQATKHFNICILTQKADIGIFKRFGYVSGRDTNKFDGLLNTKRASNGIPYITNVSNAYIECTVTKQLNMISHSLFIGQIDDAHILSNDKTVSYDYYQQYIKENKTTVSTQAHKYICQVCGYVYEGDTLPEDFICPICKHGVDVFKESK